MKNSLFACLILCCGLSFAQSDLYVGGGSYVYVDGTAFSSGPNVAPLYVTDDVNLDTNSHIYLRNEAQLLQGNDVGNSGEGELSVYQTGTVNQWSYNYWCSPIGNASTIAGNEDARVNLLNDVMTVTSSTPAGFTSGYDGSASPLIISQRWIYTYQASDQYVDWVYVGSSGTISPGLGFTMKGNGTGMTGNQVYDFRGKPNNGIIANIVADGDFTLVGNPYPSAMDSAAFIHDTQNSAAITGTLFYWEQYGGIPSHVLRDYIGGYSAFTIDNTGAIITNVPAVFFKYDAQDNVLPLPPGPPANGMKMAQRYIPIGQGFMVEGRTGSSGTVRAKNAHRIFEKEGAQSYFFRSSNSNRISDSSQEIEFQDNGLPLVPEDYKRFRINVEFKVDESKYVRQMLLNFHDNATAGFDYGLELSRSKNFPSDAYFTLDDKAYSAQAYPFNQVLAIPLVLDIEQQQPLRFRIFDIQNFEDNQEIYIHDIENDLYVNLRDQHYDLNIEPGHYADRFEIVFTNQALTIDDFDNDALTIRQNNANHQLLVLNPKAMDVKTIEVYDVAGKRMMQNHYSSVLERYDLSTLRLSDGVYIVNALADGNATIKSQKIIVKN